MLNRRLLMAQAGETPPNGGIVTDGLLMWLDGSDRGGAPGRWIDKVAGYVFTIIGGKEHDKYVLLPDKKGTGICCSDPASPVCTLDGTLEVVYTPDDRTERYAFISKPLRDDNTGDAYVVGSFGDSTIFQNASGSYPTYVLGDKSGEPHLVSVHADFAVYNKRRVEPGAPNWWTVKGNYGTTCLGGLPEENNVPSATGRYYALRYYNRKLTQAEMLQNQQHDIDTYFGGVIPE